MSRPTRRIAVIEDDDGMCLAITRLLLAAGFYTTTFASAEAFLQDDRSSLLECMIVDIHLPGISGIELGRQLGAQRDAPPIIFITAHDEPSLQALASEAGGRAYLTKPFHGRSLLSAIERATAV